MSQDGICKADKNRVKTTEYVVYFFLDFEE